MTLLTFAHSIIFNAVIQAASDVTEKQIAKTIRKKMQWSWYYNYLLSMSLNNLYAIPC